MTSDNKAETEFEKALISYHKDDMLAYMRAHPEYFDEAVELALSDKDRFSWRAAWALQAVISQNDGRLQSEIDAIIKAVSNKKDGHRRELLKILMKLNLNEIQEGDIFDICVSIWKNIRQQSSVRYTAFLFILNIAEKYPDLKNELQFLSQNHYLETLSEGIKKTLIKKINKPVLS